MIGLTVRVTRMERFSLTGKQEKQLTLSEVGKRKILLSGWNHIPALNL